MDLPPQISTCTLEMDWLDVGQWISGLDCMDIHLYNEGTVESN